MALSGTLSTMPLADLLQWIDSTRKTGTIVVETAEYTTTLTIKDGKIISSSSTDPRSYLGQFLLAHTRITEQDLQRAFERQEKTRVYLGKNIYVKTLLGKVLLEDGVLTEREITRVLRLKTEETIYSLFLCEDGSFNFSPDELPPEELVPISLDVVEVLNRGIQRLEEWKNIRARIPSVNSRFRVVRSDLPPDVEDFPRRLVERLEGGRSVHDVMLSLHSTEFAVTRGLFDLLQRGIVELDGEAAAALPPLQGRSAMPAPVDSLVERGQELFDQRAYADTVIAVRQALREDPAHPQARKLLERSERQLADSFYARVFAPIDVPHLTQPLAGIDLGKLSSEERYLLERVNGSWSIGSIVKLSPFKEVDALAMFKKLLDDGLIGVKRAG